MTEQPPSASKEALELGRRHGADEITAYEMAVEIDALIAQRVSAERERCAQIALQYRDEVDAGEHAGLGDPERALGQGYAANLIGKRIRAPAERPAPPAVVGDYTEWAREIVRAVEFHLTRLDGADEYAESTKVVAAALSAVASEHRAEIANLKLEVREIMIASKRANDSYIESLEARTKAALRNAAALTKGPHAALASTGEQPASPIAVVDYTEQAREQELQELWLDLAEKDDRTSPEEYPDMALLTRDEFFGYLKHYASAVASEREAALHAAPSPSVVDYTERAREAYNRALATIERDRDIPGKVIGPSTIIAEIATVLSAVASERDAAAIRAFGQRVWSDTEEVAYQAGVSDTRARLQEPDVLPALRRAIVAIKSRPVSTGRDFVQEDQDARDIAALTKIAEMLTP